MLKNPPLSFNNSPCQAIIFCVLVTKPHFPCYFRQSPPYLPLKNARSDPKMPALLKNTTAHPNAAPHGPAPFPQTDLFRRAETNVQAAPIRIVNCKL